MGNLLAYNESFDWSNPNIDRNTDIGNLNKAILEANKFGDSFFIKSDFYRSMTSGTLFSFIWTSFDDFKSIFPWINEPQYQILNTLSYYFYNQTQSNNPTDLGIQTGNDLNGWVGLNSNCPDFLVHDYSTWEEFHRNYVSNFTRQQRLHNHVYFKKFYIPRLTESKPHIDSLIKNKRVPTFFKRLDVPTLNPVGSVQHHELIHIHFNDDDKSALNIDGTWKHGSCIIPAAACEYLVRWGFILPENL